ncbi:MAG: NAD(P)/FAD-dependent oxidoreductase [Candidatus Lokiarchaeota archaeon]|nr:NAD(P)/FAD-dependent oxidoreductase [Candidatus Lokiarchaeota archaeon]
MGAGPVGSIAAKKCAEKGIKTLFIEEHTDIGLPQHCSGWLSGSPYTVRLMKNIPEYLIRRKVTGWRIWSPGGKQICEIDDFGFGGWFVDRQGFDKYLAKEAVRAGADLLVGTKFIDLIKKEEQIEGILVNIRGKTEEIYSNVVIGADGSKSIPMGVAKKSKLPELNKKPKTYQPGIQYEFVGIQDVSPGVIEIFFGKVFDEIFRIAFFSPLAKDNAYCGFGNHQDYENSKKFHPILSKRLKNAKIVRKMGGLYGVPLNVPLKQVVLPGLMLAGDAAGLHGIINGMISAELCTQTAIKAINNNNVSEEILKEYQRNLKKNSVSKVSIGYDMRNYTDDQVERLLNDQGKEITEFMMKGIASFDIS